MKDPKDYIIFPLDLPSSEEAMSYVKKLSGKVGLFKVGLELFITSGPRIVDDPLIPLRDYDCNLGR